MIADKVFNIIEGDSRLFPSDIPIKGKLYLRVFKDTQGQGDWDIVDESEYIVANDTVVFSVEPKGKYLVIQVSTTPSELTQTPTENTMILAIQDEIVSTALIAGSIVVVGDNISQVVSVGDNISQVVSVSDNLSYILQTQGWAEDASQSEQKALVSEQKASQSEQNASQSEQNALVSEQNSEKWATEAEDVEIILGKYSAYHWAQKAREVVTGSIINDAIPSLTTTYSSNKIESELSVKANENTVVKLTGNQTIAGIKTFSSFPVTPSSVPTTDYQVANKKYVDDKTASSGVDNAIARFNGTSGAIQTSLVKINDEGDIALGDSSFKNWYGSHNCLEVGNGSFYGRPEGNSAFGFANNAYYSSAGTWKYKAGLEACVLNTSGGNFSFKRAGVGTPDADISFSTLLQLTSSGATVYGNIYADNMFGQSQTWQDMTVTRTTGVTYTNTTGKPIEVRVKGSIQGSAGGIRFIVDGLPIHDNYTNAINPSGSFTAGCIIPNGSTYSATLWSSSLLNGWFELR